MNRPITFVSSAPGAWGAERSLLLLGEGLRSNGERPAVICMSAELSDPWEAGVGEALLVDRPEQSARRLAAALRQIVRVRRRSLVVFFSYELLALAPLVRILRPDLKLYWDHHDLLTGPRAKQRMAILCRFLSGTICVSSFVRSQVPSRRAVVLRRPVPPRAAESTATYGGIERFVVGIVGRIDPGKRHDLAIRAVSHLAGDAVLVVRGGVGVSDSRWADEMRALGERLMADRVLWEGRVDSSRVMDGLDCLIVTNPVEPMGRTVLEAQQAGVPVVVPATGGSSELVLDGTSGLTFDDEEGLTRAIDRIRQDRDLRDRLVSGGRRAVEDLTPENYARQFVNALRQMGGS